MTFFSFNSDFFFNSKIFAKHVANPSFCIYVFLSHLQFINNINLAKDQPVLCLYRSIDQFIRPVKYPILQKWIEKKFTILKNYPFIYIRFIRKMS